MAEYKNGVNFRGNMSVEADDISPDVKTGRIVFVDDDLYESDTAYKAKVDKCVEEGFVKSSDIGSGGGGGSSTLFTNITVDGSTGTLDKTFGELKQAIDDGKQIICKVSGDGMTMWFVTVTVATPGDGGVIFLMGSGGTLYPFSAGTDSDYPSGTMS